MARWELTPWWIFNNIPEYDNETYNERRERLIGHTVKIEEARWIAEQIRTRADIQWWVREHSLQDALCILARELMDLPPIAK